MRGLRGPVAGRVVVVTGAARGIGELLAMKLADRGARLALVGLEPDRLAAVAARCGPNSAWWEADVTDAARMTEVAGLVADRFRRVDVVVSNAGIGTGGSLALADPEVYERTIEVNLLGSVRTARAFLPQLIRTEGYYLQVASLAAVAPVPLMSAYCASKAGVEAFALALRGEVTHHGVDVGVAYLSFTDTDMTRGMDEDGALTERRSTMPWPFDVLWPLEPAVDRIVAGLQRRAPKVYAQPFLRAVPAVRGLVPVITHYATRRGVREAEAALTPEALRALGAGGAGGRADARARLRDRDRNGDRSGDGGPFRAGAARPPGTEAGRAPGTEAGR